MKIVLVFSVIVLAVSAQITFDNDAERCIAGTLQAGIKDCEKKTRATKDLYTKQLNTILDSPIQAGDYSKLATAWKKALAEWTYYDLCTNVPVKSACLKVGKDVAAKAYITILRKFCAAKIPGIYVCAMSDVELSKVVNGYLCLPKADMKPKVLDCFDRILKGGDIGQSWPHLKTISQRFDDITSQVSLPLCFVDESTIISECSFFNNECGKNYLAAHKKRVCTEKNLKTTTTKKPAYRGPIPIGPGTVVKSKKKDDDNSSTVFRAGLVTLFSVIAKIML